MKRRIVISDISAIMPFGSCADEIVDNLIVNQNIQLNKFNLISNFNFYNHGYKTRTRIDRSAELCIHTTAEVAKKISVADYRAGLITVSKFGCLGSKESYFKQLMELEDTQFASPKDFVQSICNIPNALATIECGLKGFSNHFVGAGAATLTALWQACKCVSDGIADEMIVSTFDVISDGQKNQLKKEISCFSESASSLRIQAMDNSKDAVFELIGFGFGTDDCLQMAIRSAISNAIKASNIKEDDISLILPNLCGEFLEDERKYIADMFENEKPIFIAKQYLGECFSTLPILNICILNKIAEKRLSSNLISEVGNDLKKLFIEKGSIILMIGNNDVGDVAAACLKYI